MKYDVLAKSYANYPYKEKKNSLYVSEKVYKQALELFFINLSYELITSGKPIKLPSRVGTIQAVKYRPNVPCTNFQLTSKLYGEHNKENPDTKKVLKINLKPTDGYQTRIYWSRRQGNRFLGYQHYTFNLTRPNLRINRDNKTHAKVRLYEFFNEKGYLFYEDFHNIKASINKGRYIKMK